jgi:hypothetical protein
MILLEVMMMFATIHNHNYDYVNTSLDLSKARRKYLFSIITVVIMNRGGKTHQKITVTGG